MFAKIKRNILDFYLKENELDISLFKLLGTAGVLISVVGGIQNLFASSDYMGTIINLLAALASIGLMWFVHTTRKYLIGYLITSVSVFMVLFAWLFFELGGMNGSIPYFFTFGIVFTLLMYKGILLIVMETVTTIFYIGVCWFSYLHPEYITPFETEGKQFFDQIAGILFAAIGIGLIFIMYIREYRKQQKIAEDSSKAKSILLANISHEVRTPINMLLGMNEMILRESENTQINEYAQNVDNAGRHLLFMINQFLDLSRIDMGKEVLFEENFNLKKMIDGLGAFFSKEAEKKRLEFVMDIDKTMPSYLYGDIQKLSQILSNLLSNAVKYTSKGTIVLSVQILEKDIDADIVDESEPAGNSGTSGEALNSGKDSGKKKADSSGHYRIHFEVSDTGNGIKPEDQEKIFESFERADIIRNRSIEGTGLGLAISNRLANLMGTKIQVKSQYGVGSAFWFDIDLKNGTESDIFVSSDGYFIAPEAKILVVDDNSMNLMVVKSLLKRTLIAMDMAESAMESYEKYSQTDYDLVLMDYMMPEIDGIQAMEHMRVMDKAKGRRTPIIVLTADATPEKKELFLSKGFDGYLLKPVESKLLEEMIVKNLPDRLVTQVNNEMLAPLPDDIRNELTDLLKNYDISFELALKHLSGDVLQFARISEYFIKNTTESIEKIKNSVETGDYETAAILIHAIKGNAGNVGGEDLYYSARRLERRAKDRDDDYVVSALPLFVMKWKRVVMGLECFLKEIEKLKPVIMPKKEEDKRQLDEHTLWEELLNAVRLGNQSPALGFIEDLESLGGRNDNLEIIRGHIRDIEFDEAETLIMEIMK